MAHVPRRLQGAVDWIAGELPKVELLSKGTVWQVLGRKIARHYGCTLPELEVLFRNLTPELEALKARRPDWPPLAVVCVDVNLAFAGQLLANGDLYRLMREVTVGGERALVARNVQFRDHKGAKHVLEVWLLSKTAHDGYIFWVKCGENFFPCPVEG